MKDRWLIEFDAYDIPNSILTTQYFDSGIGFTTSGSDTPSHQYYDARVKVPGNISRSMFAGPATTRGASRAGFGDIVLLNGDGALDYLLNYGIDGRNCTIRRTESIKQNPTYADFAVFAVATMDQPEIETDQIRLRIKDLRFSLQIPLQPRKFAGTGLGTLEGGDDLKDKEMPVIYGAPPNFTPIPVEGTKLIFMAADKQLTSINSVYDRGVPLSGVFAWTLQTSGFSGAEAIFTMAYGNGVLVAAGAGGKLWSSTDYGVTWTSRTSGFGSDIINGLAYGNGMFVAVGAAGKLSTSPDGITWTARTSGFGATDIRCVIYGGSYWAIAGAAGKLRTATDPTSTWTARTSGFGGSDIIYALAYGLGQFVAGGQLFAGGTTNLITATDPTGSWSVADSKLTAGVRSLAFGGDRFVAGSLDMKFSVSLNASGWVLTTSPLVGGEAIYGMTFANGEFIAVAGLDGIAVSTDGFIWALSDISGTCYAVTHTDAWFASGGTNFAATATYAFTSTPQGSAYASSADLLDDTKAPTPGSFKVFLDSTGSYFRLGATPKGQITCDPVEGANAAARTAGQIFTRVLARASLTPTASDVTALDAANSAVLGFAQGAEPTTFADVCDEILGSIGGSWYNDKTGAFRAVQFTGPASTSVLSLTKDDLLQPPERVVTADPGRGLPIWRQNVRWGKNYTVQTSDLAPTVALDRRTFLATEYRDAKDSDASVQTAHLLAPESIEDSLITTQAAAGAEATRRLTLRKTRKDRLRLVVALTDENLVADLATTIELTHARVGGTHRYIVLGVDSVTDVGENGTKELQLSCWGPEAA